MDIYIVGRPTQIQLLDGIASCLLYAMRGAGEWICGLSSVHSNLKCRQCMQACSLDLAVRYVIRAWAGSRD